MPATVLTNTTLSQGGIVATRSTMDVASNNLATVAAEFVYREQDIAKYRRQFDKGQPPPTSLNVDIGRLQLRQLYLADVSFERKTGLVFARCNYVGAIRFDNVTEIPLQINYATKIITRSITREGTPAYYEIQGSSGLNIGGRVAASQVEGRGIWLGTSGSLRYVPEKPSRTRTKLASVYTVYTFTYNYAICFGLDIPQLSHTVADLVRPSGGQHPYLDPAKDWVVVSSESVEAINKAVAIYSKTFTAEKYRDSYNV